MTELVFHIEEDPEGGYTARAVGAAIFTEADTLPELREGIREAVTCHFDRPEDRPRIVRLHFTRDEVMAL
ncbi:MAG: 2-oxoisovalerate dehydrogenase [Planctomycetes bacterium]|nr:2-oxoisovalerate dehydrogenase [Planctomycetota bacterium]